MKAEAPPSTARGQPVALRTIRPSFLRPGGLVVAASERGVRQVWFGLASPAVVRGSGGSPGPRARAVLERAAEELDLYFRGDLWRFTSPLDFGDQGTPFDRAV